MNARYHHALARGPVVLDAAMGTRLVALGLNLARDDPAFWNLARPDTVLALHVRDRRAGAGALVANTFGANRAWLARWARQHEVERINRRAVALAREAAGDDALVLGSIGPTVTADAVREQADVLADAGADALLFETYRIDQAAAALAALDSRLELPVLVSLVGWPEFAADGARRLADLGASVLGTNCELGMAASLATVEALARATDRPLLVKPSAGRPGDFVERPEAFSRAVPRLLECGVRFLGGCCGTTDAHVAALRAACYHHPVITPA